VGLPHTLGLLHYNDSPEQEFELEEVLHCVPCTTMHDSKRGEGGRNLHTYPIVDLHGVVVDLRCVRHKYMYSPCAHAPDTKYSVARCTAHVRSIWG
jgi:hypothetical protein